MKKLITFLLTSVMLFACVFGLSGCGNKLKEIGYFMCHEYENFVNIHDLSEEGHKQKYIVMPETINGKPYQFIDLGFGESTSRFSKNDTLEKIYFEYYDSKIVWGTSFGAKIYHDYFLRNCSALKKVIFNRSDLNYQKQITGDSSYRIWSQSDIAIYINYDSVPIYIDKEGKEIKCLVEYEDGKWSFGRVYLANVEFIFNYDDAPNNGYYWIDDIDDGEKIDVLPPEPTREGYTFDGWYCEKECKNQFDFERAIRKSEPVFFKDYNVLTNENNVYMDKIYSYPDDYVTYVYAKWIKE